MSTIDRWECGYRGRSFEWPAIAECWHDGVTPQELVDAVHRAVRRHVLPAIGERAGDISIADEIAAIEPGLEQVGVAAFSSPGGKL